MEAIECCRCAIKLEPDHTKAHVKLGNAHMLLGEWTIGWAEYEWRLRGCELRQEPHGLAPRRWDGEPLEGTRILIHAEMGFGDTLQFVRFVPLVAARGGRVVLEVQPELHRLLSGYPATDAVIPRGASIPFSRWHYPLIAFHTFLEQSSQPFLHKFLISRFRRPRRKSGIHVLAIADRASAWSGRAIRPRNGIEFAHCENFHCWPHSERSTD